MMSSRLLKRACLLLLVSSWLCSLSDAKRKTPPSPPPPPPPPSSSGLPVRAVCLGGWLVTEGWILPSLFDAIPNKDLLDGAQLQLKAVAAGAYLTAAGQDGAAAVVANRTQAAPSASETFKGAAVVAVAAAPGPSETFQVVRDDGDKSRVRIRAPNGHFLQVALGSNSVTTDYYGESTSWGDDDPSVFVVTKVLELQGEYQICNGYGTAKATPILR
uniref:DUF7910 domain-containing protein n=1 Tax=Oryza glaberrima TaxID=4538 RepID=I1PTP3_ORYGL